MLIQTFNRRIIIKNFGGTSLAVQRLRHCLPMQGARVRVLVRELRYHMPHGQTKQNINNRSDIVTKSICSVSQSCPTLCNLMNCSPPGSSVHGIFQAQILEQVAISNSKGSFQPRDQTQVSCVSCIGRWDFSPLHHLGSPKEFNKDFKSGSHQKNCLKSLTKRKRIWRFPWWSNVKNPPWNAGDTGLIPGPGRSHMPRGN